MSIFGKIKDAIFGKKKEPEPAAVAPAAPTAAPAGTTSPPAPAPAAPVAIDDVDVEKMLSEAAAKNGSKLNWRSSIVDLMKLLDLDSSLDNRKELATELGYSGAKDGSAEMNIWLHKAVMRELEKNGGTVPASMKD